MEDVEALLELAQTLAAYLLRVERDRDLVPLAAVAHVGGVGDAARGGVDALVLEPLLRPAAELVEDRRHVRGIGLVQHPDVRARELVAEVRDDVAERTEQARRRRHDHRERAHDLRDRVRVHRPGAAVGDERELARVVAALDGDDAQRAGHVLVHDREDPLGGRPRRSRGPSRRRSSAPPLARRRRRAPSRRPEGAAADARRRRSRPSRSDRCRPCRTRPGPARHPPTAARRGAPSSAPARGRSSRRPPRPCARPPTAPAAGSARSTSPARSSARRPGRARRRSTCRPCRR